MNEAETRQKRIDALLKKAGWNIDDPSRMATEMDHSTSATMDVKRGRYDCMHFMIFIYQVILIIIFTGNKTP